MIQDFFSGISSYGKALRLISKLGLWGYLILPGIIGLGLASLIGGAAWTLRDDLGALLVSWLPLSGKLAEWLTSFSNFLSGFLIIALGLILFKHLLMIAVSPLMSPLAQKVEEHLTGRKSPYGIFSISQALKDLIRGLRIAFRNIFREILFSLLVLTLGLIPVIGLFSTVLLFLIQAYYAGFGNLDYTLERHYTVKGSVRFVRDHRGLAIGNGTIFLLLISTGIGAFLAPTLATIAGASEAVKHLEEFPEEQSISQNFV